jgi:type IV pilus assembly protein PilQ
MMVPPRRFSLLVAAAALGAAPAPARAAAPRPAAARPAARDLRAAVTAVRVAAGARGGAEVTVHVDRAVEVQHFTLDAPRRVVVDLGGATLPAGAPRVDGSVRGVAVRASQFRTGVVRVVVELDAPRAYRVERTAEGVRVIVDGGAADAPAAPAAPSAPPAPAAERPDAAAADAQDPPRPAAVRPAAARPARPSAARRAGRPAPRAAAAASALDAEREAPPRRPAAPARLTVTYQDADIRDVIAAFAAFSGRTIIAGRDVTGTVTAEIKDQPWDVALRALLGAQGLAASEDRYGIITVDSWRNLASTRAVEPMATQVVDVNYAKAAALLPLVQALLSRDCGPAAGGADAAGAPAGGAAPGGQPGAARACVVRGAVTVDTATNKLLVTDVPSRMGDIFARLKELDVRTPQVAIKAKIVFVNRTGLEDIGVSYDLGTGTDQFYSRLVPRTDPGTRTPILGADGKVVGMGGGTPYGSDRVALGGNALSALANADRALMPSALNLIYSATIGRFQLTSFINALQQTSLADVQSEPSIVTLNNRTAEIFVGQQIPIRVIDASAGGAGGGGGGGGASFPRATVRLEEAGIRLSVTPQVTNNRRVVLDVKAENSNAQLANSDVGVVFNRQRAENRVLVGDGETAVIGGLTVTEKSRTRTGIPVLMNLPVVGRLFGQTTTSEIKRDLLILVTPHILDEGEQPDTPAPPAPRR